MRGDRKERILEEATRQTPLQWVNSLFGTQRWKASGTECWQCRCPLPGHDDRTPSFTVWAGDSYSWRCFGCGRGGDYFALIAEANNLDCRTEFRAVLDAAEEVLGLDRKDVPPTPKHQRRLAANRTRPQSAPSPLVGVSAEEREGLQSILREHQERRQRCERMTARIEQDYRLSPSAQLAFGLGMTSDYRPVIPVYDDAQELQQLKYHKRMRGYREDRGYPFGKPKQCFPVWGLNLPINPTQDPASAITRAQTVLVTEGELKAMRTLWDTGLPCISATTGSSGWSHTLVRAVAERLKKLGFIRVVLLFDGDEAGTTGARNAATRFRDEGLSAAWVEAPPDEDLSELESLDDIAQLIRETGA